jgi:hypothetical protein
MGQCPPFRLVRSIFLHTLLRVSVGFQDSDNFGLGLQKMVSGSMMFGDRIASRLALFLGHLGCSFSS